ncbi:hypothetical protein Sru01_17710 [Sphaerisporangium rufum]|uniref:Uncharacterized protein n=1 Tax=Sphaerisporangium rufum TaxID=1381558 RepID=A0A919QZ94_9ACTN|nr:hypothetical protein [Sphaerisporangium rufum]GII76789.1 hypothetical protein Sru01_17710 [Sphaerisporangium rufum]
MSIEWVNGAIEEIRAWGRSNGISVDIDEVRLLCDYASDYLNVGELADFTPETFEQLLLDIYPRKVITPPESAPETVAAARTLVDYLLDSGEIGTKMAGRMRARIDRIAPEMPAALADTTRYGMAKSIFGAMGADALEQGMPAGLVGDAAGPRPRRAHGGTPGEECECPACTPLPAVRLAPPAEVAAAVRDSGLLRDAHLVAGWVLGGGHTPTAAGALRVRDARRVAAEHDVGAPALAWELAVALGLVEVEGRAVRAAAGLRPPAERDDPEVLDLWARTVAFLTGGPEADVSGSPGVDREIYAIHDMLYRLRGPVDVQEIAEHLEQVGEDTGQATAGGGLAEALDALARCGTVERAGGVVRLTPHGLWGLRETYARMGVQAPVAADPAECDAAGLIEALTGETLAERADRDIAAWLARRSPEEAARELLGAVAGGAAVPRGVAVTVVDRLGPAAEPAVREFLDDPELRPHAVQWLSAHGLPAPRLTPEEVLWVGVDMLAPALPSADHDPEAFAGHLAASGPPAHVIEEMWRVDHPDVAEVLDLLGRHLPDPDAAKAARKAAFKARSRGIG